MLLQEIISHNNNREEHENDVKYWKSEIAKISKEIAAAEKSGDDDMAFILKNDLENYYYPNLDYAVNALKKFTRNEAR